MKRTELKKIIKESIKEILKEEITPEVKDVVTFSDGLWFRIEKITGSNVRLYDGFGHYTNMDISNIIKGVEKGKTTLTKDPQGKEFNKLKNKSRKHIAKFGKDEEYFGF